MIYQWNGYRPSIESNVFIAENSCVIGQVSLTSGCSIWFGAVLRADDDYITIDAQSNIQDNSVLHVDRGCPLSIGARVTVGHQVMLHGCTIEDDCLIGIGAVILNGARISRNSLVGAGALVTEGKQFPSNSLIIGSPARVVGEVKQVHLDAIAQGYQHYVYAARQYQQSLRLVGQVECLPTKLA